MKPDRIMRSYTLDQQRLNCKFFFDRDQNDQARGLFSHFKNGLLNQLKNFTDEVCFLDTDLVIRTENLKEKLATLNHNVKIMTVSNQKKLAEREAFS